MKLLSAFLALCMATVPCHAGDDIDPYVKIFENAYIRAQVTEQLKSYINHHPEVVGSTSPLAGSETVHYLSQMIAAYEILTAKNDTDRLFAAAGLFAANPYVAAALFVARICVAVNNIKLQKSLQDTYERIAKLREETVDMLTRSWTADLQKQKYWIDSVFMQMNQVAKLEARLRAGKLFQRLSGVDIPVAADDIETGINLVFDLQARYAQLEASAQYLQLVDREHLNITDATVASFRKLHGAVAANAREFSKVVDAFQEIFRLAQVADITARRTADSEAEGELYAKCVELINHYSLARRTNKSEEFDMQMIESCTEKFQIPGADL